MGLIRSQLSLPRRAAAVAAGVMLVFSPMVASAVSNPFFSVKEARHGDLSAFTKWTSLKPRFNAQRVSEKKCTEDDCPDKKWEGMLADMKGKDLMDQLDGVNRFFNAVAYVEDSANYGKDDYWATPYEMMKRGGDCEDYAIAKFMSLKRLGVSENSMRIIILQDNNLGGIMHAVLEVRAGGKRYLLDNQAKEVTEVGSIFHYRPIYAINSTAWWTYN